MREPKENTQFTACNCVGDVEEQRLPPAEVEAETAAGREESELLRVRGRVQGGVSAQTFLQSFYRCKKV